MENVQDGLMINIMKTKICLILTCLILTNCATQKLCNQKFPQVARIDSIYIETLKEVEIPLPGDTIEIEIPIDCPDQEVGTVEIGRLKSEISILNKKLTSKTTLKPDTVKIYVPEIHEKMKEVFIPEKIKYVPKFTKIMSKIGIASILLLAVLFGLKMRNKGILKIFK